MKPCVRCKLKPRVGKSYCVDCRSAVNRKYYEKKRASQPTYYINHNREARKKNNEFLTSLKQDKPCTDCGLKYPPYVMDFDHLGDKEFELSSARSKMYTREKVLQEISKCELVCSNCHRERTYQRAVEARLGKQPALTR